jgi:hypothetical protein
MRILLDTNILIHREGAYVSKRNIGDLFGWMDKLGYQKCIHPLSAEEISKHRDERVRRAFQTKLSSYISLYPAPLSPEIEAMMHSDRTENDRNDSLLLNELYQDRVDLLLTEDRGLTRKAERLGLGARVFGTDGFLERIISENPQLTNYRVLSVKKVKFGEVDLSSGFFDSFREDYPGFDRWYGRKAHEEAYVSWDGDEPVAFLFLKMEGLDEDYRDISPMFLRKRRLKIGTLKVVQNGFKIGERFLKIIFDNAIRQNAQEIYVTIFGHNQEQERLINLFEDFGFVYWGEKQSAGGIEKVYTRDMSRHFDSSNPKLTFPYFSQAARTFFVPIYPDYHTELLPDSILRTEAAADFEDPEPHRNAIRKVYVSRSIERGLRTGDLIVFYRTGGIYKGVVTTIGIVDKVHNNITNEEEFFRLCRKRSVYTDKELKAQWDRNPRYRPFIVEFLYAYSFPKRPNLLALIENHVIADANSVPQGFKQISASQLFTILSLSQAAPGFIVD